MPFVEGDERINRKGRPKGARAKKPKVSQETLDEDMRQLGPAVVRKFKNLMNQSDLPVATLVKILCYISDYNKDSASREEAMSTVKDKIKNKSYRDDDDDGSNVITFSTKSTG